MLPKATMTMLFVIIFTVSLVTSNIAAINLNTAAYAKKGHSNSSSSSSSSGDKTNKGEKSSAGGVKSGTSSDSSKKSTSSSSPSSSDNTIGDTSSHHKHHKSDTSSSTPTTPFDGSLSSPTSDHQLQPPQPPQDTIQSTIVGPPTTSTQTPTLQNPSSTPPVGSTPGIPGLLGTATSQPSSCDPTKDKNCNPTPTSTPLCSDGSKPDAQGKCPQAVTGIDCSKTPNDPSCKVDCSKTPNDPSCPPTPPPVCPNGLAADASGCSKRE